MSNSSLQFRRDIDYINNIILPRHFRALRIAQNRYRLNNTITNQLLVQQIYSQIVVAVAQRNGL